MCLDGDLFLSLFLLRVLPFRNHLFFFPHIPAVQYHLLGVLSPSSHSYVLLSKKPCSTPAKSPSFFCNNPYSPTCIPALVLHNCSGEAGKAAPDQVALEILVVCRACMLPYYLVKEWQTFSHVPSPSLNGSSWILLSASVITGKCAMDSCIASRLSIRDRDQLKNWST